MRSPGVRTAQAQKVNATSAPMSVVSSRRVRKLTWSWPARDFDDDFNGSLTAAACRLLIQLLRCK